MIIKIVVMGFVVFIVVLIIVIIVIIIIIVIIVIINGNITPKPSAPKASPLNLSSAAIAKNAYLDALPIENIAFFLSRCVVFL